MIPTHFNIKKKVTRTIYNNSFYFKYILNYMVSEIKKYSWENASSDDVI